MSHPHHGRHEFKAAPPPRDPDDPNDPWKGLKVGDRIRMTAKMPNDPDPVPKGAEGTVKELLGTRLFPQVDVTWDNGRTLFLLPDDDPFEVIS